MPEGMPGIAGIDTLIVGCGDIGLRVLQQLVADGRTLAGLVRTEASAQRVRAAGGTAIEADLGTLAAGWLADCPGLRRVFWFAPPPREGLTEPLLRTALARGFGGRCVYISTSGVYGDCAGAWVDESHPPNPRTERAQRRLDAERALADVDGLDFVVLRVPGIYGPGRLPRQRLLRGLPVIREAESPWSNRIHAEDLASVAIAAAARGQRGGIYNVSDGHPTTMTDYFTRCARLLDLPAPPQLPLAEALAQVTPAMRSFLEESRRLDTAAMRRDLAVDLRYPILEQGLAASLAAEIATG